MSWPYAAFPSLRLHVFQRLDERLRLVQLFWALPCVRRGFIRLGCDSDEWQAAAEVLCAQPCCQVGFGPLSLHGEA
jgi:hypothetical protein